MIGVAAAFLVAASWPSEASACKILPYPDSFSVNPTLGSSVPPPPSLQLVKVSILRSRHAPPGNGDCGDVGSLTLQFAEADGTPWPTEFGVHLALERGVLPQAFTIPSEPLTTSAGALSFAGGDDPAQPIDFTLQATGVNAGGIESTPIEVHVSDPGSSCACAIGRAKRTPPSFFVGVLFFGLVIRRARRGTYTGAAAQQAVAADAVAAEKLK